MNTPGKKGSAGLVIAVVVTVSVSGYFMGLRQTGSQISLTRTMSLVESRADGRAAAVTGSVPVAVRYRDQNWLRDGPNANWNSSLTRLVGRQAAPLQTNVTDAERALAIAERSGRRAYDGAPPTIPHPVPQESTAACLACHASGLAVRDRVASRISHAHHAACTQCHVPAGERAGVPPMDLPPPAGNAFVGWLHAGRGTRAWEGAPPTIPHATWMRDDCLSCHGERGLFGLRTPHPERVACEQCHVPDAGMDQRRFLPVVPPGPGVSGDLVRRVMMAEGRR